MERYEAQITLRNAVHYLESQRYDTPITGITLDDLSDAIYLLYKAMEMNGKESFSVKRLVIHDFIDDGTGACAFPFGQTYCGYRCNDEIHGYKALPADWFEDSSLETWFPLTAQELAELKRQLAATQESYRRVSDLAVNLTATLRSIANANYREWEELATPGEFVKWAQSVARNAISTWHG